MGIFSFIIKKLREEDERNVLRLAEINKDEKLEVGDIILLNTVGRKILMKNLENLILDKSKKIYDKETVVVWVSSDGDWLTFEGMHPFSVSRKWVEFIRRP